MLPRESVVMALLVDLCKRILTTLLMVFVVLPSLERKHSTR
jgi:hypothetical protein